MRRLMIAGAIFFVLLIAVALVLPYFLDVNQYHDRIQSELENKLKRPVSLGRMHLSLLPLSFQVENAVIGEDPAFNSPRDFARAERLNVSPQFLPLLHKDLKINRVELERPKIELIRNAQGVWNFSTISQASKPMATSRGKAAPSMPSPVAARPIPAKPSNRGEDNRLALGNLRIMDGEIAITDLQQRQPRSVYDHIDLDLRHFQIDKPFHIDLAVHLPGEGKQLLSLSAEAGPVRNDDLTATAVDGAVKLDQVTLAGLKKFLSSASLNDFEAIVSGESKLKNDPSGKMKAEGQLKIEKGRIHGVDLGFPLTASYDLAFDNKTRALHISKADMQLGSTPLVIEGNVQAARTPAAFDVHMAAHDVPIRDLARLAAAFGAVLNPDMHALGKLNADLKVLGTTAQPELRGTISVSDLSMSSRELPQPVKVSLLELTFQTNQVRSNQFTATSGGTSLLTNFTLNNYSSSDGTVDASLKTANASVGELVQIARAYGVSAMEGITGTGGISLDVQVHGPLKNAARINYAGTGSLSRAQINLPQLTKPIVVKNAGIRFSQNSALLENIAIALGSMNATGMITVHDFQNPNLQFSLALDRLNVTELEQITRATPGPKRASLGLIPAARAAAPAPQGALANMSGTGTLSIATILYDQIVMNNARSNVSIDHGIIRLAPLTAELFGGSENGSIVVDMRGATPTFSVNTKLDRVDSDKLLSSVSSLKQTLYGLLAANASANFVSGSSTTDIAKSLNGNVGINLQNGKLANVDLLYQLASIGKFLETGRRPQAFTNIVQLTGNLLIRNGVAQTDNLKAAIDGGTVAATGAMNLVSQVLDMRLTAVLAKSYSDRVGGNKIGGFLNTALANNKGELVIPVLVTGTFQKPSFAPDMQKIAQMKIQNLLPTSSDPSSLTTGILGAIVNGKPGQGQPAGSGFQGVLGVLGGKRQQQDQGQNAGGKGAQPQAGATSQPSLQNPGDQLRGLIDQLSKKKKKEQQPPPPK